MTHEATRLAEEIRRFARRKWYDMMDERIDALAALAQPAPTAEVALPAVSEPGPWIPRSAADVRDFLGLHCNSLTYGDPSNPDTATDNDAYELTAHDLLSAFVWAGHFDEELAARAQSTRQSASVAGLAAKGDGWRPIETAPRDGTELLLWRDDCGQFIGSYTSGDNFPLTQDEIDMMAEEVLFQKDWFTQWPDARRLEGSELPTLWQPLPPPPLSHENPPEAQV